MVSGLTALPLLLTLRRPAFFVSNGFVNGKRVYLAERALIPLRWDIGLVGL